MAEIPRSAFNSNATPGNHQLVSVETSEAVTRVHGRAFRGCTSLRNIAFTSNTGIEDNAFDNARDMFSVFASISKIRRGLKHRFDGLPIHKMVYYQSYHNGDFLANINSIIIDLRFGLQRRLRSKLNPTGKKQDSLGMTPLHILACSSKHAIPIYRLMVENYPDNLITKDNWEALPILYAVWGNAPSEIIELLIESYKTKHPDYQLDWEQMLTILSIRASLTSVKCLIDTKKQFFSGQCVDWQREVEEVIITIEHHFNDYECSTATTNNYRFLLHQLLSRRINSIGIKVLRDNAIRAINKYHISSASRNSINEMVKQFELQYKNLKETVSLLELCLWKKKIEESSSERSCNVQKKMKMDKSDLRNYCRVSCGSGIVVEHVLPYLLPNQRSVDQMLLLMC